jgi:hypothetical protein
MLASPDIQNSIFLQMNDVSEKIKITSARLVSLPVSTANVIFSGMLVKTLTTITCYLDFVIAGK